VNFKEYRTAMSSALVTGGSRGFGLALAAALVGADWDVVVDGRDRSSLEAAADRLGPRLHIVPGDVTDPVHRGELVDQARRLGGLDLLVNNAGTLGPSPLPPLREVDPRVLMDVLGTNVVAPLALIQLALPLLEERGGAVINVTSDAAVEAYEGWGTYGASKAALEQLSNVLAAEVRGVTVWWLDPGDMRTEMHQAAFPGEDISDRPLPESVIPAVVGLLDRRPPSGRIRASDITVEAGR
jgi:NAD(P)-dependent dehydrogenase (short-subunit alcohol dehydrogenase family)